MRGSNLNRNRDMKKYAYYGVAVTTAEYIGKDGRSIGHANCVFKSNNLSALKSALKTASPRYIQSSYNIVRVDWDGKIPAEWTTVWLLFAGFSGASPAHTYGLPVLPLVYS